jgi:hypothetical protein
MKTHTFKIFIVSTILISSCNNFTNNHSDKSTEIPAFLQIYKWTILPVSMKGCFGDSYYLPLINQDSLISSSEDGSLEYCTFKTNGDYYAVIRLGLADCALPYLITYDKNGKVIDNKSLGIGSCGSGPGFACEEFTIIKNDFTIYSSDTISTFEIDSLGDEIKGTREYYIIYKKGRLLKSGKIELSDELKQTLEK